MVVEFVPSDPGPAPTLPQLTTPGPTASEAFGVLSTTLVLLGIVAAIAVFLAAIAVFLWTKRRRIVTAVDNAVIEAVAKTVKGSRKFWQRVQDRPPSSAVCHFLPSE
jgi:hypothetical protein